MNRAHIAGLGFAAMLLMGSGQQAWAGTHTCNKLPADEIEVDGMMDDWKRVGSHRVSGTNANHSFDLRCGYDSKTLYISLDVRDQKLKRGGRGEDGAQILLTTGGRGVNLRALPGVGKTKPKRTWSGRKLPSWIDIEDSLQPKGWSLEVGIPLSKIPGWTRATPLFNATISVFDSDGGRAKTRSFKGKLQLAGGAAVFKSFLRSTKLRNGSLTTDRMVDVDGIKGAERVVTGGKVLGVLTDKFAFINLPVRNAADVLGVKVVDLAGAGRHFFLTHLRQHGNGGSREVVLVWTFSNGRFSRILGVEVKKTMGANQLTCKWYLAPKGRYRKGAKRSKRGRDLVVEATKSTGWDEDSYEEIPARDVKPILQPWEDQTTAVYWFRGSGAGGGAAKTGK